MNSIIIAALSSLNLPCVPGIYSGDAAEYIAFNYFSSGNDYADDTPQDERFSVQVHYCCPVLYDSVAKKEQIKRLLFAADFSWPGVTDASDKASQHWVFESDYLQEVSDG